MKGQAVLGALLLTLTLSACRPGPSGAEVTVSVVMPIGDPAPAVSALRRGSGP